MNRRIAPVRSPKSQGAGQRGGADAATTSTSRNSPSPKFWPGDGGRYIGTGDITLTASPDTGRINVGCYRQMLHGRAASGSTARPASTACSTARRGGAQGKPCEVVAAYGVDPVLFMLAAQVFGSKESEFDVAGGMMGRGIELTDGETVSLPIPAQRRARDRRRCCTRATCCRKARSASSPATTAASARRSR